MKENREYRSLQSYEAKENYIIEGYATTWDPYILYENEGVKVYEQISKDAFAGSDMTDIILQVDHAGKVYARKSNNTLEVRLDTHGMWIRADLSTTQAGRELYDEIKAGMYTKMSWAFTVKQEHYDAKSSIRHIDQVHKVYDVSVVARPQNDATSVSARSWVTGVAIPAMQELQARAALVDEYMRKVKVI